MRKRSRAAMRSSRHAYADLSLLTRRCTHPKRASVARSSTPQFIDKAAVLTVRIARNHPLLDGNKRLAWAVLNMFAPLNGHSLRVATDDAFRHHA
jgi:death on curing protein